MCGIHPPRPEAARSADGSPAKNQGTRSENPPGRGPGDVPRSSAGRKLAIVSRFRVSSVSVGFSRFAVFGVFFNRSVRCSRRFLSVFVVRFVVVFRGYLDFASRFSGSGGFQAARGGFVFRGRSVGSVLSSCSCFFRAAPSILLIKPRLTSQLQVTLFPKHATPPSFQQNRGRAMPRAQETAEQKKSIAH
jgi:hypothetical protein